MFWAGVYTISKVSGRSVFLEEFFFLFFFPLKIMCMSISHANIYMHHMFPVLTEARRRHQIPQDCLTDVFEALCIYWEFYLGPLQKQQVVLTSELAR